MIVGGRLQNSRLSANTKHSVLLDSSSRLSLLNIKDEHRRAFHAGSQLTMAKVREDFWIPRPRVLTRQVIARCPTCIRFKKEAAQQLMGNLLAVRVNITQPFLVTGWNFAGPLNLSKNRGRPTTKGFHPDLQKTWVFVFVTRAIHLDITIGLSVDAFLETFARLRADANLVASYEATTELHS